MLEVPSVLDQVRRGTADIGVAQNTVQTMTIRANDWALGGYCQTQCRALTQHHEMESAAIFPYLSRCEPSLAQAISDSTTSTRPSMSCSRTSTPP